MEPEHFQAAASSTISGVVTPPIGEKKSPKDSEAFVMASRRDTPEVVESSKKTNDFSGVDGA